MVKRFGVFFLFSLLLTASLGANGRGEYYGEECGSSRYSCLGGWSFDAEFLYFMPSFDDTYFVIQNGIASNFGGTRYNNDFNYKPGFRVGATYALPNCCKGELQAYYTRLYANQSRTIRGEHLWATVGPTSLIATFFEDYTGSALSQLNFLYQRVDGFYSTPLWCRGCVNLEGLFGLELAYLRLKEYYRYASASASRQINAESKIWGIGPQCGFDFDFPFYRTFCCPGVLSFVAKSTASLLVSRQEMNERTYADGIQQMSLEDQESWRIIPAFHARVGFNYAACISCWNGSIEVGYEFTSYLRTLTRYNIPDDNANGLTFTNYYNTDVQGLYVAANVCF